MIQLYFLSILCNGLSGYILFNDNDREVIEFSRLSVKSPTFHLILGILSAVIGILKLLSPSVEGIPILGDLIPSAAGIVAGIMLIFGIHRKDFSGKSESPNSLDAVGTGLMRYRKPIGLVLLGSALIHFLFPQALFL